MPKNYKNILSFTSEEGLDFFMKFEQFDRVELPEYFLTSSMHYPKHAPLKDMKEKQYITSKVYDKLCKQHNFDYNQLWFQNMTYTQDKKRKMSPYTMWLCQLVMGESQDPLWNNEWQNSELSSNLPYNREQGYLE